MRNAVFPGYASEQHVAVSARRIWHEQMKSLATLNDVFHGASDHASLIFEVGGSAKFAYGKVDAGSFADHSRISSL